VAERGGDALRVAPDEATEMSKYVKELMMDQLKTELDGDRSVLILDLKGLDAITEYQFRRDLRKKSIKMRVLRNTLARRVFEDMGMGGLSRYLEGPSVAVWGGAGVAELAKEISDQVKKLKKPEIKGGSVDGTVIGPEQLEDITKLPSREALIGRVVSLALAPVQRVIALANAPASGLLGQLKTLSEGAPADEVEPEADAAPAPAEGA
jgi:large subunit ribosomal protein L10